MSDFVPEEYFQRKLGELAGPSVEGSLYQRRRERRERINAAAQQRIARLEQAAAELKEQRAQDDRSWANKVSGFFGTEEQGVVHNTTNLVASGVAAGGKLAGGLVSAPANMAAMNNEAGVSDESRAAFQRLRDAESAGHALQNVAGLTDEQRAEVVAAQSLLSRAADAQDRDGNFLLSEEERKDLLARQEVARNFLHETRGDIQGRVTEEDRQLLQQRTNRQRYAPDEQVMEGAPTPQSQPEQITEGPQEDLATKSDEERLRDASGQRIVAEAINEVFDWSSIVHQGNMREFTRDLSAGSTEGLDNLAASWKQLNDGEMKEGLLGIVSAATDLAVNAGPAVLSNPMAMVQVGVEQVPQLALAASSGGTYTLAMLGQGMDLYRQGYENYMEANNGAHPPVEVREHMATNALGYTAAMFVGDQTLLRMISPALKPGQKAATSVASRGANVGRATVTGGAVETMAEGFQTYAEGQATNQPASMYDIYEGMVLGGAAGAGISGGGRTISETLRKTEQDAHNQGVEKGRVQTAVERASQAVEAGDVSPLLDQGSESYSPLGAAMALTDLARQEGLSETQRAEYVSQAAEAIEAAQRDAKQAEDRRKQHTKEGITRLEEVIAFQKEEISQTEGAERAQNQAILEKAEESLREIKSRPRAEVKQIRDLAAQTKKDLEVIKTFHSQLSQVNQPTMSVDEMISQVEAGDPDAVNQVLSLAMTSPDKLSAERAAALADNPDIPLTQAQRTFLSRFSESQALSHQAKQTKGVNQDIFQGSRDGQYMGLNQYRQAIGAAVMAGNTERSDRLMGQLQSFEANHTQKSEMAAQAYAQVQGTQNRLAVVPTEGGGWQIVESIPSQKERQESGALIIHTNSDKGERGLIKSLALEVQAIQAAVAELQAAVATQAPTPVSSDAPIASAEAEPVSRETSSPEVVATTQQGIEVSPQQEAANEATQTSVSSDPVSVPTAASEQVTGSTGDDATTTSSNDASQESGTTSTQQETTSEVTQDSSDADLLGDALDKARAKRKDGKLKVFARTVSDKAVPVTQAARDRMNVVASRLRQGRKGMNAMSKQPLVEEADFLNNLDRLMTEEGFAESFLGYAPSAKQVNLIRMFAEFASLWESSFEAGLLDPSGDRQYHNQDYFRHLIDESGNVEQNVWTAMSAAGFSWLSEQGTSSPANDVEAIRSMLGNDMASIPPSVLALLSDKGTRESLLAAQLGRRAVQALGIYAAKNAPANSVARLEVAMGNRILGMLDHQGLLTHHTVTQGELDAAFGRELDPATANLKHQFVTINEGAVEILQSVSEASKGTKGVLSDLFGMEKGKKSPGFQPTKYKQERVKNTDRGVPSGLRKILAKENQKAQTLRTDSVALLEGLSEEVFLEIGGAVAEGAVVHEANELGAKGKTDALKRSLANAREFIGMVREVDPTLAQEFFLSRTMWLPGRVGLEENLFNPQSDKLHRILTRMDGWESTVTLGDAETEGAFWLAVGEGLGVKTDAMSIQAAIGKAIEKTQTATMQDGIEALMRVLNGEAPQDGDNARIVAAVKQGDEGFHSLDALIAMAHYYNALSTPGATSFTHNLTREVDGKTNGPMLAMLMLGAGSDSADLTAQLAAGGFFDADSGYTQVADWAQEPKHHDLYKQVAALMADSVAGLVQSGTVRQGTLDAVYQVIGRIQDDEGGVTGEGRGLVKTPITALMFGAGVDGIITDMADDFLHKIYSNIEKALNKGDGEAAAAMIHAANALLPDSQRVVLKTDRDILKRFKPEQEKAIREAFEQSLGQAIKGTLETRFGRFMAIRDNLNAAANTAFELYDMAYQHEKDKLLAELMAAGRIQYTYRTDKRTGKKEYVPEDDLTAEQEAWIREKLKPMEPVMHSAWSKQTGELENGIYLAKSGQSISNDRAYSATSNFKKGYLDQGSKTSHGLERQPMAPGVAAIILAIHSTDSYIASSAYSKLNALNVHDAEIVRPDQAAEVAKYLNQATYEIMGNYSVAREVTEALERTVAGFYQVFGEQVKTDPELQQRLKTVTNRYAAQYMRKRDIVDENGKPLWNWYFNQSVDAIGLVYDAAVQTANYADSTRLGALARMESVDQYPMYDGNHVVSPEERKANADKAALAGGAVPKQEILQQGTEMHAVLKKVKTEKADKREAARKRDMGRAINEVVMEPLFRKYEAKRTPHVEDVRTLSRGVVLDLVDRNLKTENSSVIATLRDALNAQDDFDLTAALASMGELEGTQAQAILQSMINDLPPRSVWGPVGVSRVASDPALVDFFHQAGDKVPAHKVMQQVQRMLQGRNNSRMNQFYRELVSELSRAVPRTTTVTMVTPTTDPNALGEITKKQDARGYYTNEGRGGDQIVLLSPSFMDSGLTLETVVHELVHAAIANQINNPSNEHVQRMVHNLQEMLSDARAYVAENKLEGFEAALVDLDEFTAWGMTNQRFQREVLAKLVYDQKEIDTRFQSSSFIGGMKRFIDTVRQILFRGSKASLAEQHNNGLAMMIANVSGLVHQRQTARDRFFKNQHKGPQAGTQGELVLAHSSKTVDDSLNMSSMELFEALGETGNTPQLRVLMETVVEKLHGPFETWFREVSAEQPMTPIEVLQRAETTGHMPFVSESLTQGFALNQQEQFVLEHLELAMRTALDSDHAAYQEMAKLWKEAKAAITKEMLLDGDWALASEPERDKAQAMHDFLFKIQGNDRTGRANHLSRFAALMMVQPDLRDMMGFDTARQKIDTASLPWGKRLQALFENLVNFLFNKMLKTRDGQRADHKLEALMRHLVDAHHKQAMQQASGSFGLLDRISEGTEGLAINLGDKVGKVAKSNFFANNRFASVRFGSKMVTGTVEGRLSAMEQGFREAQNEIREAKEGALGSLVTEIKGAWDNATKQAHALLRETKNIERIRLKATDTMAKAMKAAFANNGKDLDAQAKSDITKAFLRTELSSLLGRYSLAELSDILTSPDVQTMALETELAAVSGPHQSFYLAQAKATAYQMVNGLASAEKVMLNAHNIANLYGTKHAGSVSKAQLAQITPVLDQLISLYAVGYVDGNVKARAIEIFRQENARTDGNGIELVLKRHQAQREKALELLFDGKPELMQKGYTPELYNNNISLETITPDQWPKYEKLGYQKLSTLPKMPNSPEQILVRIVDGGQTRRVSGIISTSAEKMKGTAVHAGLTAPGKDGIFKNNARTMVQLEKQIGDYYEKMSAMGAKFDPVREAKKHNHIVPELNDQGQIVNYRYMMSEVNKDNWLKRDNSFDLIMGSTEGSMLDKVSSKDHNRTAMQALKDQFDAEFRHTPHSYVRIAPDSTDPELKEHWDLLPYDVKQEAIRVWGKAEIMVRADLVTINFGYRKLRMTNAFHKEAEERNWAEKAYVGVLEEILPRIPGIGGPAYLRARQTGEAWTNLVTMIKDNVVIKNVVTLNLNIMSNTSLLVWQGVPLKDIVQHHRVATKGALDYQRDYGELIQLQNMLEADYLGGQDRTEMEQRVRELEDSIARNPAADLIEAGLMPTIVEDVTMHDDPTGYKSWLEEKAEPYLARVPEKLREAGKVMNVNHDTTAYKLLNQTTQLSDFVARYTLYQYLTTRKNDPTSKAEAIQRASDSFVNYDVPTGQKLQYLNDTGLLMFTKYYLRIQRVMYQLYREHPGRAMAMLAMTNMFGIVSIHDSWFLEMLYNPLRSGAIQFLDTWDEPFPIKMALSVFR